MRSFVVAIVALCLCCNQVAAFLVPKNILGTALQSSTNAHLDPSATNTAIAKTATSSPVIWSVEYENATSSSSSSSAAAAAVRTVEHTTCTPRLFSFHPDGTEVDDLLPPLERRLDLGVGCYFEESDRLVLYLLHKTQGDVHPADACWALEACKGDQVEALIRISVAQRLLQKREEHGSIANNLYSQDAVPLEWKLRRHVQKRNKNKRKRKLTGVLVARVALFLGLCRFVFGGARVFFLAP